MAERNAGFSFFTFIFLICISNNAIGAFNLVGTHPYASINWHGAGEPCDIPNRLADGRTIKSLQAYDGGIYSGYGDWRCNTGPIRLCKFNPSSNTFSCEFTQATESIARFRVLNGDLYSVSVDPQPPNALGHAYAVKKNGVWSSYSAYQFSGDLRYYPVHAYDMNTYGGSLWFFSDHWTGETANDLNGLQHPRAWRSNNNGSSWFDALSLPQYGTAQIFCFGETLNGKLYVQAAYLGCTPRESVSRVYDGTSWSTAPTLAPTGRATRKTGVFSNKIVMIHDNRLYAFDGTSTTMKGASTIHDYTIIGNDLYVIKNEWAGL